MRPIKHLRYFSQHKPQYWCVVKYHVWASTRETSNLQGLRHSNPSKICFLLAANHRDFELNFVVSVSHGLLHNREIKLRESRILENFKLHCTRHSSYLPVLRQKTVFVGNQTRKWKLMNKIRGWTDECLSSVQRILVKVPQAKKCSAEHDGTT